MSAANRQTPADPEKRDAIVEQAIRTFAECGYRDTDVQVVADRAGVGKGTVYRYFSNKEDLFWSTCYEVLARMERSIFAAADKVEGAYAKLRAAALAHARFFEDHPDYLELTLQERAEFRGLGPQSHRQYHEKLIARMAEILQHGIDSGELRPVDPRQTTLAVGCLVFGAAFLTGFLPSMGIGPMSEYAVDIFLRGLCKQPACSAGGTLSSCESGDGT